MKHVKLFEEFDQSQSGPKTYILYVNDDKHFQADVRDQDGKIIFEISEKDLENDSLMKSKDDIQGLTALLVSKNKIKQGDSVVSSKEYKEQNNQDFTQSFNTNQ